MMVAYIGISGLSLEAAVELPVSVFIGFGIKSATVRPPGVTCTWIRTGSNHKGDGKMVHRSFRGTTPGIKQILSNLL